MKTIVTLAGVSMIALATLADATPFTAEEKGAAQLVNRLVLALQSGSSEEFVNLFPTLEEFHRLMKENENAYGNSLTLAQEEFATTYRNNLLPSLRKSFDTLIEDGKQLGIDWSHVRMGSWSIVPSPAESGLMQLTLVIVDRGNDYKIVNDKALFLYGEVHVSPYIRII